MKTNKKIHLKTSKSLRPPTIHYMQLVYMPWWQQNILTDMPTFFQIMTTVLLFDYNCGSLHIWTICDENNHCTKKSTPPSCNYGFEYPCQQAKCTFPIRVPVIGGLFRNPICRAGGRVLKGGFFSERAIRFSNIQISKIKIFQITILSLKFEFVIYCYWREI